MDSSEKTFDINQEHPEFTTRRAMWGRYRDLYVGGEQLIGHADRYLVRRQKEPGDVYAERLSRSFYENYIGSIVDWYTATLFRREPVLTFEGKNEGGRQFFGKFIEDCDLKGTHFAEFFRRQFVEALVCGKSYTLIDFPRVSQPAETRAEEDERGVSRAYLVGYSADELVNWSHDDQGQYQWVVLRTRSLRKDRIQDTTWGKQTRWVYYDKEHYRIYEQLEQGNDRGRVELVREGRHGLAKLARVPIIETRISEGLWLLNKAGSLQLEHFQQIECTWMGADHGAVCNAGGLLGPGMGSGNGRILLHTAWPARSIRLDRTGWDRLPDRCGQPYAVAGRDLQSVLCDPCRRGAFREFKSVGP